MANISVTVQDGNNITLVTTPTPTQVITIDRGIAGPAGPAGVPAGSQYQIQYNSGVSTFAASPNLTFNGSNLVLQSASSTTAFRITQTGTGNAFVVEDSASTDATPFVVSASGDVGIGTTTPSSELHIARGDATSYDGAATDGQLAAGATVFVQQTAGTNTGVSQIVFQSRITFPYNRIVSSGGSAPFMTFVTNNAERMRISSAGDVGIGTTSPSARFTVVDASSANNGTIWLGSATYYGTIKHNATGTGANEYNVATASGGGHQFQRGGTTLMDLNQNGNLGLGVTPSAWNTAYKAVQVGAQGAFSTAGNLAVLSSNWFSDSSFANKYIANNFATRYTQLNGTHYWDIAPTGTAGAAITFTQAMTLASTGDLLIGTTIDGIPTTGGAVVGVGSSSVIYIGHATGVASGDRYMGFSYGTSVIGSITQNGTTGVLYNIMSDYRLKNITGPITSSGAYIDSLKPVEGTWKADGSTFVGLIAHETQEVSRTTVATGTKDGEEMQGMDYSSSEIIANLIAEIQSLRKRVAALEPTPFASYEQFGISKP